MVIEKAHVTDFSIGVGKPLKLVFAAKPDDANWLNPTHRRIANALDMLEKALLSAAGSEGR
jgi:hypothetical protein